MLSHEHARRLTPQAEAIAQSVEDADHPLTAQDVLEHAKIREPGLGIATVHRQLKRMVEEGLLARVEIPGEAPRFEPAHRGCGEHFKCESCGRVFDLPERQHCNRHRMPEGFIVRHQHTLLLGVCPDCAKTENGR